MTRPRRVPRCFLLVFMIMFALCVIRTHATHPQGLGSEVHTGGGGGTGGRVVVTFNENLRLSLYLLLLPVCSLILSAFCLRHLGPALHQDGVDVASSSCVSSPPPALSASSSSSCSAWSHLHSSASVPTSASSTSSLRERYTTNARVRDQRTPPSKLTINSGETDAIEALIPDDTLLFDSREEQAQEQELLQRISQHRGNDEEARDTSATNSSSAARLTQRISQHRDNDEEARDTSATNSSSAARLTRLALFLEIWSCASACASALSCVLIPLLLPSSAEIAVLLLPALLCASLLSALLLLPAAYLLSVERASVLETTVTILLLLLFLAIGLALLLDLSEPAEESPDLDLEPGAEPSEQHQVDSGNERRTAITSVGTHSAPAAPVSPDRSFSDPDADDQDNDDPLSYFRTLPQLHYPAGLIGELTNAVQIAESIFDRSWIRLSELAEILTPLAWFTAACAVTLTSSAVLLGVHEFCSLAVVHSPSRWLHPLPVVLLLPVSALLPHEELQPLRLLAALLLPLCAYLGSARLRLFPSRVPGGRYPVDLMILYLAALLVLTAALPFLATLLLLSHAERAALITVSPSLAQIHTLFGLESRLLFSTLVLCICVVRVVRDVSRSTKPL